ncbi:GNAT family N-acetyltransferase [Bordetella genomosp. 12]|uniref:GNAT family N-acetyltransferase n=1 Tax=Bordetella genomosp. 12 TaxID=463035 RepID=A0A261VK71_9BORD|nr:GNAT family N-acetyltransferase [Bordetella genomosp. 12]OZI74237.1 GNAT family N-acetyltransferase [Bordetella genomosp. 12]
MDDAYRLQVDTPLASLDPRQWDRLAGEHPTLSHAYFSALHETGCASPRSGWTPFFLTLHHAGQLAGAVPLYLKTHSRGEYVFDHAWADAYERHGLRYYPKLLAAVPFTPVPGPRLLAVDAPARRLLAQGLVDLASTLKLSSLHVLFAPPDDIAALRQAGCLVREGVQFHWRNAGHADFDSFLAGFNHDKRKKLRQDRKKVHAQGVSFQHLSGRQIGTAELAFFYACYERTYLEHGNPPYLTAAFFERLLAEQSDSLVLVLAHRQGQPLACALNLRGGDALYGRYWGTMQFLPGLHFETCYMQAIEYCIRQGLSRFEGGAQGEHKMARGLMPVPTQSAHWIADPRFAAAIDDFLGRETTAVNEYLDELARHTPLRRGD